MRRSAGGASNSARPSLVSEGDVGPGEGEEGERLARRPSFRGRGAQELATGRRIEEQSAHGDGRAALPGGLLPRFDATADHPQPRRGAAVDRCLELEARDRRDRGKRLAAEAEGADADQVPRAADLAGGVALQGEARVVRAHALPVVAHPDQCLAAILEFNANGAGARVERVFHQFLDDRCRPLDHLARGDLVGHRGRQDGDRGTHSVATSRARTQPRTPSRRATRTHAP